jgi:hypothetical protein
MRNNILNTLHSSLILRTLEVSRSPYADFLALAEKSTGIARAMQRESQMRDSLCPTET